MDNASESRSVADGGSLRSVAQGSARSLPAPQEPTSVALYQARTSATPLLRSQELLSVWESPRESMEPQGSICHIPAIAWETEAGRGTATFLGPTASRWWG